MSIILLFIINTIKLHLPPEKEAILKLKNGSHEAFSFLYQQYWNAMYNFTRLYINSIDDSKEIVQQVFIKLWESRALLKEDENFKGFLFIITRNIVFNSFKRSFNENSYKISVLRAFSETIYANELKEYLQLLINALPPRQKEIFLLSREENLSYQEIADKLGISIKTVEHSISKSLKYLKSNVKLMFIFFAFC